MQLTKYWKGHPYPLGATWMGDGVNFAIFSEFSTGVELCLFDAPNEPEVLRVRLNERTDHCWHIFLPEIRPGQLYSYRVEGEYNPKSGMRFNPNKVVLDPYAKAIAGPVEWGDEMFTYIMGDPAQDLSFDPRDNVKSVPKAVVIDPAFAWGSDRAPRRPFSDTVIYELHVKGFTKLWEKIPPELRGTYAGISCPEAIAYFKALGITAVELLPVHQFFTSRHLEEKKLHDYWGYNTIGFFAPHAGYSSAGDRGGQVVEFKTMVQQLHAAGLEVILDVVYNHTVEGNHLGPTLSFRGVDNLAYYRTTVPDTRMYMDYTGTGNTLNVQHPRVLQLLMDSLRYWVLEMHVDGFRFDLAAALAREFHEVSKLSAFFDVIHQDPVISQVKLIAEPWDVGDGGYQVGNFPVLWAEWNGRYRDTLRRYWKGDSGHVSDLAFRLCGSADLYQSQSKSPTASINFITSHDGFCLRDLVSFDAKHNEANQENNQDGDNGNHSWNCGFEGLDAPAEVLALRRRQQRNLMASLLLSQGVPMLRAGDEAGATQQGNNNAYCQDNEISWLNWAASPENEKLREFTQRLIALRREHAVFRQSKFLRGRAIRGAGVKDITWINADALEMQDKEWEAPNARFVGLIYRGDSMDVYDYFGTKIKDQTFLIYFNAHHDGIKVKLPGEAATRWRLIVDTYDENGFVADSGEQTGGSDFISGGRTVQIFQLLLSGGTERSEEIDRSAQRSEGT